MRIIIYFTKIFYFIFDWEK